MAVRVRFAPSPTGYLHLGGLRTALFNYLFAASAGGKCILRVEDTDRERTIPGSFEDITNSLRWAGVAFDEGPLEGGQHGPYIQSQRSSLYQHYAKKLVKTGAAYHCFCSKERLDALRQSGSGYDGYCRRLSSREIEGKFQTGTSSVIRLRVPRSEMSVIHDLVYGCVQFSNAQLDDQVLLKSDGLPTYHLANVVDDHEMGISHVLRGEEWLLSTAKHLLLYQALSWQPPLFAHLPLLLNHSGGKLSKRNQDVFVRRYKERGFLPEALTNFTALLGWHPKTEQQIFTMNELRSSFSLGGVNRSGAVVDENKLVWLNGVHFSRLCGNEERLEEFTHQLRECLMKRNDKLNLSPDGVRLSSSYLKNIVVIMQERTSLVPDIPDQAPYFWTAPDLTNTNACNQPTAVLPGLSQVLKESQFVSTESLKVLLKQFSSDEGLPLGRVMSLCRWALTGGLPGPAVPDIMILLGQDEVIRRLHKANTSCTNTGTS